jgi:tetratricopeptide (TPR) repeat protein
VSDPSEQEPREPRGFSFEFDRTQVEESFRKLRERVQESLVAGRHTKVRLSFRGRTVGPDIPLGVFLAGEGLAFFAMPLAAALLVNLGAKAILDVEFVHEADELVQQGLQSYMDGELEEAERKYREALDRRPDDPSALYNLGTLLRVAGRREEAIVALRKAAMGPDGHPDVRRAADALEKLTSPQRAL